MAKRRRNSAQPGSSRGNDDANDDANDANWLNKDFENQLVEVAIRLRNTAKTNLSMKHQNYHVECVQNVVKYIRGSTQRIKKFKKAMKDVAVDTKRFLCSETPTRWNSTFELLTSAYDVRDAFVEFGMQEKSFEKDVDRVPEFKDFEEIKKTIDFIEKFKTKTEKVSCSTKPLIHQFTREILDISLHLTN
ncbi:hypothetical protein LXL04_018050 [Taraxacum kok-saghyz]